MKHILLCNLLIITSLTGMITTDFSKKSSDDIFKIMEIIHQNKAPENMDLSTRRKGLANRLSLIATPKKICQADQFLLLSKEYYKECIVQILPLEICKQIDITYSLINNNIIEKTCIGSILGTGKTYRDYKPMLTISNNGHYVTHNMTTPLTTLIHTKTIPQKCMIFDTTTSSPVCFSPNSKYCVIKKPFQTYLYNISQDKIDILINDTYHRITISNDSQHILLEGRNSSIPNKLFTSDTQNTSYKIPFKNNLWHSTAATFHPDNKHIIHNNRNEPLHLYNIVTKNDKKITSHCGYNVDCINSFTFNHDNSRILAETTCNNNSKNGHILFNIEDLDKITSITLPPQSCHKDKKLPVLYIPHKKMLTLVINEGHTLQLLNENNQIIAWHNAPEKTYISALAVDNSGNYLAIGHSDGTIFIWHLYNVITHVNEKFKAISKKTIESLTFGDNHLLLSQSTSNEYSSGNATLWDIYGNEIINFGDSIIASIMSQKSKNSVIVLLELRNNSFGPHQDDLMLSSIVLDNKKVKQLLKEQKNSLTLTQMFIRNTINAVKNQSINSASSLLSNAPSLTTTNRSPVQSIMVEGKSDSEPS